MNSLTPVTTQGTSLIPQTMDQAIRLAEMMARGKMLPEHLRNSPGDCLMVVEQAMRWGMSPFAVAQCTSSIKGKLMFEGKLVAAAVESSGAIEGFLDYQFSGEGPTRKITVIGRRRGEKEPRTVEVVLKNAATENDSWRKQPDQQLVYHGARVWARRWTPGVALGVYSPEEMGGAADDFAGPTIDARPDPLADDAAAIREMTGTTEPAPAISTRKVKDLLDEFDLALRAAIIKGPDAVDEVLARNDIQRAQDWMKGAARERLRILINEALDATRTPPTDDFPGDVTSKEAARALAGK